MKFFISQPMKGKTPEAIKAEREYLKEQAIKATDGRCEFIESYKPELAGGSPITSLAASIAMLADADMVIFAHGWEQARGCCIENAVAQHYGIKCVYAEPAPFEPTLDRDTIIYQDRESGEYYKLERPRK